MFISRVVKPAHHNNQQTITIRKSLIVVWLPSLIIRHPPYQMPVAQINPTAYIQQQMHMNGHYMPKYSVNNPPPSSVYPAQQPPQQQVSTQPPKTRERKALKIIDPVSGAVINDEIESEPPNRNLFSLILCCNIAFSSSRRRTTTADTAAKTGGGGSQLWRYPATL